MADTGKGDVPKDSPATNPPDPAPTIDTSKTTPPKDVEMKDAVPTNLPDLGSTKDSSKPDPPKDVELKDAPKVASADHPPPPASTNPDANKTSGETDTKATGSLEPTGGATPTIHPTNTSQDTIASTKDVDMKDASTTKPTEAPTSTSTNISKPGSAPALPLGDIQLKNAGLTKPTDENVSSTPDATALNPGKAPLTGSSKPVDPKDAGPKSTATAEIIPPKDDGKPFTKLHMVQVGQRLLSRWDYFHNI
jgi:hypothetical protein